jgi:hypothetical protein
MRFYRSVTVRSQSKRRPIARLSLVLALGAWLTQAAHAADDGTLALGATVTIPAGSADWYRPQQLSNGYVVSFGKGTTAQVTLTSLATHKEKLISVSLAGVTPLALTGAAVGSDASVTVSGIYNAGSTATPAGFLANLDVAGHLTRVKNLGAYVPLRVCSAGDGSTWVLGQDMEKEAAFWAATGDGPAPSADYAVLSSYSADGLTVRTQLKRSELHLSSKVFANLAATPSDLVCGSESVGAYIAADDRPTWFEASLDGKRSRSWSVVSGVPTGRLTGWSLPFENNAYGSVSEMDPTGTASIYRLSLGENGNASWARSLNKRVSAGGSVPSLKILGHDGTNLVYADGATPTVPISALLVWGKVTRTGNVRPGIAAPFVSATDVPKPPRPSNAGVEMMISMATEMQRRLSQAPQLCADDPCLKAAADLRQTVDAWKRDNEQGARSMSSDSETKLRIMQSFATITAALKTWVAQSGGFRAQDAHSGESGGTTRMGCPGSCEAEGILTAEAGLVYRTTHPNGSTDSDGLLRVACTDGCNTAVSVALTLCGIGATFTGARAILVGIAVGLVCLAGTLWYAETCWNACEQATACKLGYFDPANRRRTLLLKVSDLHPYHSSMPLAGT